MRRAAFGLIFLVCAALLVPPATAARDQERGARIADSRVVVERDRLSSVALRYDLWGRVGSRVKACTQGRTVHLATVEDGRRIKTVRTGRRGGWHFVIRPADLPDPSVRPVFRVSTTRKVVRVDGQRVLCRPASMRAAHSEIEIDTYDDTPTPPTIVATGDVTTYLVDRCLAARRVTFRNLTLDSVLGSDQTDRAGHWEVPFDVEATGSMSSHTYRATVARKVVSWRDNPMTCLSATDTESPSDAPMRTGYWGG